MDHIETFHTKASTISNKNAKIMSELVDSHDKDIVQTAAKLKAELTALTDTLHDNISKPSYLALTKATTLL